MAFDLKEHPHRRLNLLTGEWILVSPHRMKRPWQGKVEAIPPDNRPAYDPKCYLCPGNTRADGTVNPKYTDSFVFTNDFAALLPDAPEGNMNTGGLLQANSERGTCRVISFTPDHSLTLPELEVSAIEKVIKLWMDDFKNLSQDKSIKYIQIFENKGEIMGCSNPHPHGQIWCQDNLPVEIIKETREQQKYFETKGSSLLADYLQIELKQQERIVVENDHFLALVPFWAVWPYETMIISKRQVQYLTEFNNTEITSFADILKRLTTKYDNLFEISFPYSAGLHQAPVNDGPYPGWHFHMHFYPPLLRSATVKKFMVGYEMLANPQRDVTAEWAAEKLRNLPETHYKQRSKTGAAK